MWMVSKSGTDLRTLTHVSEQSFFLKFSYNNFYIIINFYYRTQATFFMIMFYKKKFPSPGFEPQTSGLQGAKHHTTGAFAFLKTYHSLNQ